jgi:CHAT domain-containing protein
MVRAGKVHLIAFAAAALLAAPVAARGNAAEKAPSRADSFAIGTSGAVCDAQGVGLGKARGTLLDRRWLILCRDIGRPVGAAYALRGANPLARVAQTREEALTCDGEQPLALEGGLTVQVAECRSASGLDWKAYAVSRGGAYYRVEGLAGYDSALRLGLRNLVEDRVVPGEVQTVNIGAASTTGSAIRYAADPQTLLGAGYRSNNAGAYVEAAALFEPTEQELLGASSEGGDGIARVHEMRINRALQLSNLGEFGQAARLFAQAAAMGVDDPVQSRLSRNYRALDALNQNDPEGALAVLDEPVAPLAVPLAATEGGRQIDRAMATGLNAAPASMLAGVVGLQARLSIPERITLIDAQAEQLRGTVYRLSGKYDQALETLSRAMATASGVREGRVISTVRMNAQILSELALTHEAKGEVSAAEGLLRQALRFVEVQYPDSASVDNARARLAGFLTRHGQREEARTIFHGIVESASGNRDALVGMTNLLRPYFDLLVEEAPKRPELLPDLFVASQLVERPGAADAMELLARRLEGGNAEASALFRQSQEVARELERTRILIARQSSIAAAGGDASGLPELNQRRQRLLDLQASQMNALADYPQYRAVSNRIVTLDGLKAMLRPGEAYLKLVELGGAMYAVYVSPDVTRGWRVDKSPIEIADLVTRLRSTISLTIAGNQQTYPFDVDTAADLYDALLGPVAGEMATVRHLMFEPDGAMLKLPLNLLTGDRAGIAAYHRGVERGGRDQFDFTGIAWLGRNTRVSTALSAATFRDARRAPASHAGKTYLGLGENLPLGKVASPPHVRGVAGGLQSADCQWPVAAWNRPISARELREASRLFGTGQSDLMVDAAFTDTAVIDRPDLASYRILHFATHGLVTPPHSGCPAEPALLTSFGGGASDGLLSFGEIFDLKLDADLVILSACDTAAQASVEATREAGVGTGGGQALDGLVRAFIAAGGRQVIASHWPAPDDYGATRRLFSAFFADRGDSVADALQHAQLALMDDPQTSHPFYWAGFAIIGDGARHLGGE